MWDTLCNRCMTFFGIFAYNSFSFIIPYCVPILYDIQVRVLRMENNQYDITMGNEIVGTSIVISQ